MPARERRPGSVCLDAGELDHLCPFLGFVSASSCSFQFGRTSVWWPRGALRTDLNAYEIDSSLDRHEVDDGPVLDLSAAVLVRFSERVLCALGREQDAGLGCYVELMASPPISAPIVANS
jgi:hypothetical protein